jgi:hypothetical protein
MTFFKILLLRVAKKMEWFENGPSVSINQQLELLMLLHVKLGTGKSAA